MLPQAYRIQKWDFLPTLRYGAYIRSAHFDIRYTTTQHTVSQCGIIITKKSAKHAVTRNAYKRAIRLSMMQIFQSFPTPLRMIILLRTTAPLNQSEIYNELYAVFTQIFKPQ